METSHAWIEYLNISTSDLEAWKNEAPADVPLLVWCLKEKKIPFDDYATWAKNHYSLPVIRHEFFSNQPSLEDFEPADWSPWMVPLGTWEGLTYIGCVMPPPDPVEGCIYLLADPADLYEVYSTLKESTVSKFIPTPASQENEGEGVDTDESTHYEMPDGLILDLKSPMSSPVSSPEEPEESRELEPEAPEGLTLNFDLPPSLPDAPAESAPAEEEPELTVSRVYEEESPSSEELTAQAETEPPPAAAVAKETSVAMALPEAPLKKWWEEVQKHFAHAVLLKAEQDQFHALWKDGESREQVISLSSSSPSLFRIALRTKKPYHGFVIENEVHSQFFNGIGVSGYPSCVTALLVKGVEPQFIVSFFGFVGNEGEELPSAETLATSLAESLKNAAPTMAQVA